MNFLESFRVSSFGKHSFAWMYHFVTFDNNKSSVMKLYNKLISTLMFELHSIEAKNSKKYSLDCYECNNGVVKGGKCEYCKEDYFYDVTSLTCRQCQLGYYSYGSTNKQIDNQLVSCLYKPSCSINDIKIYKDNEKITEGLILSFDYDEPKICEDSSGVLNLLVKTYEEKLIENSSVNYNENINQMIYSNFNRDSLDYESNIEDLVYSYLYYLKNIYKRGNIDYCLKGYIYDEKSSKCIECTNTKSE